MLQKLPNLELERMSNLLVEVAFRLGSYHLSVSAFGFKTGALWNDVPGWITGGQGSICIVATRVHRYIVGNQHRRGYVEKGHVAHVTVSTPPVTHIGSKLSSIFHPYSPHDHQVPAFL